MTAVHLREEACLAGHTRNVWSLAWAPDGASMASCSGDMCVRIWERQDTGNTWCCSHILETAHSKTIRAVAFSPDGNCLASASFDGTTAIWKREPGAATLWQHVATLEGHENEVKCVAFAPSGNLVATCGRDKSVWIWESFPGNDFECVDVKQGHTQDVKMVAWHPSQPVLASASYDDTIKLWVEDPDGGDWYCAQTLEGAGLGHASTVWALAYNRDGSKMASCSDDRTVKVWACDMKDGAPFYKLTATISDAHSRAIFSVDWSSADALATACGDNCVRVFQETAVDGGASSIWELAAKVEGAHLQDVNCVRWHPSDSTLLVSCSDDGTIKSWRYATADDNLDQMQVDA